MTDTNYGFISQRPLDGINNNLLQLNLLPGSQDMAQQLVREQEWSDLEACVLADRDEESAKQTREAYGKPLPLTGDPSSDYLFGSKLVRTLGIERCPEQYFIQQGLPVPRTKGRKELYPYVAKHFRADVNKRYDARKQEQEQANMAAEFFESRVNMPKYGTEEGYTELVMEVARRMPENRRGGWLEQAEEFWNANKDILHANVRQAELDKKHGTIKEAKWSTWARPQLLDWARDFAAIRKENPKAYEVILGRMVEEAKKNTGNAAEDVNMGLPVQAIVNLLDEVAKMEKAATDVNLYMNATGTPSVGMPGMHLSTTGYTPEQRKAREVPAWYESVSKEDMEEMNTLITMIRGMRGGHGEGAWDLDFSKMRGFLKRNVGFDLGTDSTRDLLMSAVASTAWYALTRGAGTFLSTSGEKGYELLANGSSHNSAIVRGFGEGAVQTAAEGIFGIGGRFTPLRSVAGRAVSKVAHMHPVTRKSIGSLLVGGNKVARYGRGWSAAARNKMWRSALARFGADTLVGAGEEMAEELFGIWAGTYLDTALAKRAGETNTESFNKATGEYEPFKAALRQTGELVTNGAAWLSFLGMGAGFSGLRLPAYRYDRKIATASAPELVAMGVSPSEAPRIASIADPEKRKAEALRAGALGRVATEKEVENARRFVAGDMSAFEDYALYDTLSKLGVLPDIKPALHPDGSRKRDKQGRELWTYSDKRGSIDMTEDAASEAMAGAMLKLNAEQQAFLADMVVTRALVNKLTDTEGVVTESVGQLMDTDYFTALADAAKVKIDEGADPDSIDPDIDPGMELGQVAALGAAWQNRLNILRHDEEQRLGRPLTEEEFANIKKKAISPVSRQFSRKRQETLFRFVRGEISVAKVLEDIIEDSIDRDMRRTQRSEAFYVDSIKQLETELGKVGQFLEDKDSYTKQDIIEALGKIVESKVLADTAKPNNGLSDWVNDFLDLLRKWVGEVIAFVKLGNTINKVLSDKQARERLGADFVGMVENLAHQNTEFMKGLQRESSLRYTLDAATRKPSPTPTLTAAMEEHGEQVKAEAEELERQHKALSEDIAAANGAQVPAEETKPAEPAAAPEEPSHPVDELTEDAALREWGRKEYNKARSDRNRRRALDMVRVAPVLQAQGVDINTKEGRQEAENMAEYAARCKEQLAARALKAKDEATQARVLATAARWEHWHELDDLKGEAARWDGKARVTPRLVDAPADDAGFSSATSVLEPFEQEKQEILERAIASGEVIRNADGTLTPLAPNGKPSKFTLDQWLAVRTKAFKNYFGDWERKAELTLTTEPMPNADADAYLREHASGKIKNLATGIEAEVNSGQRDKMLSKNAKEASAAGGFSYAQHNYAASRVATLFRHAILMGEYEDKNHTIPAIMRFACPLMLDGKICFALMTVKKSQARKPKGVRALPGRPKPQPVHGHTIYSIQLDKIEEFGNQLGRLGKPKASRSPNSKGILDEFNDAVKTYFEDVSKVLDENGEPLVVYHQTGEAFTVFDPRHNGAGSFDNETPHGIFTKPTPQDIGLRGDIQMPLFMKADNPLVVRGRYELARYLRENVPGYKELKNQRDEADARYGRLFDEAMAKKRQKMLEVRREHPNATSEEKWALIEEEDSAVENILEEWERVGKELDAKMKSLVDGHFALSDYDALIIKSDQGSFGRVVTSYVALHPEQVKSASDNRGTFAPADADITHAVSVAREVGIMQDGKLEASNGTLYDMGGASFSILARHASPHSGIRKFLMEFIGTGEGAQAYGHGMYFSTNEGVHRSYVRQFRNRYKELVRPADNLPSEVFYLVRAVAHEVGAGHSKEQVMERFRNEARERYEREKETLEYWEKSLEERKQEEGYYRDEDMIAVAEREVDVQRMEVAHYKKQYDTTMQGTFDDFFVFNEGVNASEYEVMLNFERNGENLLRWDEPVPFELWQKIKPALKGTKNSAVDDFFNSLSAEDMAILNAEPLPENHVPFKDGEELYKEMVERLGSPKAASEALLSAGIKGVEYRDATSRKNDEDVTYNYVMFDEADVKVVRVADAETGWEPQDYEDADATFSTNLAAVHSLSRERFLEAATLGGMPMPSIAVTRLDKPYAWGGDDNIYLVGEPSLVDPERGNVQVGTADLYSGTFPKLKWGKIDYTKFDALKEQYLSMLKKYGFSRFEAGYFERALDENNKPYFMQQMEEYAVGRMLFAAHMGYMPRRMMKEYEAQSSLGADPQFREEVRDLYYDDGDSLKHSRDVYAAYIKAAERAVERAEAASKANPDNEQKQERAKKLRRSVASFGLSGSGLNAVAGSARLVFTDMVNAGRRVPDREGMERRFKEYAAKHKKEFKAWLREMAALWSAPRIEETGEPATLANLTRVMRANKGQGKERGIVFGTGLLRAQRARMLTSLAEMKGMREGIVSSDELAPFTEATKKLASEYVELAMGDMGSFRVADAAMQALAKKHVKPTPASVCNALRSALGDRRLGQNSAVVQKGVELLKALENEPVDYLEAVPMRAVTMDEWKVAVLPTSMKKDAEVQAVLQSNGITPRYHDGTKEGREKAMRKLVNNADVSFAVSPTLREDITEAWHHRMKAKAEITLCACPDVFGALGIAVQDVITKAQNIKKIRNQHKLSIDEIVEAVEGFNDPVLVYKDTDGSIIMMPGKMAANKQGVVTDEIAPIQLEKTADGKHFMVSLYSLENLNKVETALKAKDLLYCKYTERALASSSNVPGLSPELLRLLVGQGFSPNTITEEDVVKWKQAQNPQQSQQVEPTPDFSSAIRFLDSATTGHGGLTEERMAFAQTIAENVSKMLTEEIARFRSFDGKVHGSREKALVAIGAVYNMARSVAMLMPEGYRVNVRPYLNQLQVFAELAASGKLDLTADMASQDVRGMYEAHGSEDGKVNPMVEWHNKLVQEHGNEQVNEVLAKILSKVGEKLTKMERDAAVESIRNLLKRLEPQRDPKTGKLKRGIMSAEGYDEVAKAAEAMQMSAEELDTKLTELEAAIAKAQESGNEDEVLRLQGLHTLYSTYGDLKSMSLAQVVAAYENLQELVKWNRWAWDEVLAERKIAQRDVINDTIHSMGGKPNINELDEAKAEQSAAKSLLNIGDAIKSLPHVLSTLRKVGARRLADSLSARINEALKACSSAELARAEKLEALSRYTLGKSWRQCMNELYKREETGIAFTGTVKHSGDVKREYAEKLVAMTPAQFKEEMEENKRAGGTAGLSLFSEDDVRAMREELAKGGKSKVISYSYWKAEATVNRRLTRANAMYIILMLEQPTYTERLREQGYTEEFEQALRKWLGDDYIAFAYGLRDIVAENTPKLKEVYERQFGVPFPAEENYFPAKFDVPNVGGELMEALSGFSGQPGANTSFLKPRVNHSHRLDSSSSALQVMVRSQALADYWIYTQDIVADLNAYLLNRDFCDRLTVSLGNDGFKNFTTWVDLLRQGGARQVVDMGAVQRWVGLIYGANAVAVLGFRIQTLFRQFGSLASGLLAAHDVSLPEWFITFAKMKHRKAPMTYKLMAQSDLIKNRKRSKGELVMKQAMRGEAGKASWFEEGMRMAMVPMEQVDAFLTTAGLVPVWNIYYDRALRAGRTKEEATMDAWIRTEECANKGIQPMIWANKSKLAQEHSAMTSATLYMLSEDLNKLGLSISLWQSGHKWSATRAWLTYGAINAAISALLDSLQGDPDDWDEAKWWEYLLSAIYGPLASCPGIGELVENIGTNLLKGIGSLAGIEGLAEAKTHASVGRAVIDVEGSIHAFSKLWEMWTDDDEYSVAEHSKQVIRSTRPISTAAGAFGGTVGYGLLFLQTLMNPVDFGARVWEAHGAAE